MIKIGINGFGRVGRAIFRQLLVSKQLKVSAINDIYSDVENHAYLLKYDSTYGKLANKVRVDKRSLLVDGVSHAFYSNPDISSVPWHSHDIDLVIDASGISENVSKARLLLNNSTVKKVIVTHAPSKDIDITLMDGVNFSSYDWERHHVISSSICDANAVAPFFKVIDDTFDIELSEITTLHPWLQYQNLLDSSVASVSSPGHFWKDYALGRSSVGSLLPKNTTLVKALEHVIPELNGRMHATSFRTPTSIVSAADGVFLLRREAELEEILECLGHYCGSNPGVLRLDDRSLISVDYAGIDCAAVVDTRWLHLNGRKLLKFVLWYDNEWGYASRAIRVAKFALEHHDKD